MGGRGGEKSNKPDLRTIEARLYFLFGNSILHEIIDSFLERGERTESQWKKSEPSMNGC